MCGLVNKKIGNIALCANPNLKSINPKRYALCNAYKTLWAIARFTHNQSKVIEQRWEKGTR